MAEMLKVKYTGNADPRDGTGAINGLPGRTDILLGGFGEVTEQEYSTIVSGGHLLEIVTDSEIKKELAEATHDHGGGLVHAHPRDFSSMTQSNLQDLADVHDLDVKGTGKDGAVSKADLEDALTSAHSQQTL